MHQHEFGISIAKDCARQATCIRRHYGCALMNPETKQIIATGYAGSPRGKPHCNELNYCIRDELNVPPGQRYELCSSVHDLQNALIQAGRLAGGCIAYLYGEDCKTNSPIIPKPCFLCTKMAINAGVTIAIMFVHESYIQIDLNELYDEYIRTLMQEHGPC